YRPQDLRTPYEKFRSLPDAASFLRPGVTLEQLALQARRLSDNDSAARLLRERKKLFEPILAHLASAA
ncbi:MAG: integrase, partial [Gammaproteobacteria bacterium]|nr:integrase [Gammaproteobacteria bacterium]